MIFEILCHEDILPYKRYRQSIGIWCNGCQVSKGSIPCIQMAEQKSSFLSRFLSVKGYAEKACSTQYLCISSGTHIHAKPIEIPPGNALLLLTILHLFSGYGVIVQCLSMWVQSPIFDYDKSDRFFPIYSVVPLETKIRMYTSS